MRKTLSYLCLAPLVLAGGCERSDSSATPAASTTQPVADRHQDMVLIPGGTFRMGTSDGFPFEGPVHEVTIDPFYLDRHEVSVEKFRLFVQATGYRTEAEQWGWSGVFRPDGKVWQKVDGANWQRPLGPGSQAQPNEPAVHISYADAEAYATWAGKRLPTEAEFEFAVRGGLDDATYAWGDQLHPDGTHQANIWQGIFPDRNENADGYAGVAPVGSFACNGYGLFDMTGNVWEWCSDWYAEDYYRGSPSTNPAGPQNGTERVMRGGSWMCSENYCVGYRVAARNKSAPDSGLNNVGFRCARNAPSPRLD